MLASIAMIVAALYLTKSALLPVTDTVLLSVPLSPVCNWFERHWIGRVPAVVVTALVGFTVLGGFVDNAQQKDQATKVTRSVKGVKEVRNDLEIRQK